MVEMVYMVVPADNGFLVLPPSKMASNSPLLYLGEATPSSGAAKQLCAALPCAVIEGAVDFPGHIVRASAYSGRVYAGT